MKKLLSITLILFICSSIVLTKKTRLIDDPIKDQKEEAEKKDKNLRVKAPVFEGVHKIQAIKSLRTKTRTNKPRKVVVSTIGQEIDKNTTVFIDKAPFKITRCDQVVGFESEFIPDDNDYTIRKKAFFTMSAYHFGKFTKKDINTLEVAFVWSNSRSDPFMPIGAENCLSVDGGENVVPILMCAKNREEYDQFNDFIDNFSACRRGAAWGVPVVEAPIPNPGDQAKEACAAAGFTGNPDEIIAAMEAKEAAAKARSNPKGKSDGFWVPGGFKVPGTPQPEDIGK
jgi:hypothetical protein